MEEITHATTQIKVRAAFTMMLIFVVLSEMLGTEIILGAFLAGAVISLLRTSEDAELTSQLEAIGFGFFIPIFFIKVGIDFNLAALLASPQSLLLVPLLLISALLVKIAPMLLFRHVYPWRETIAAGTLLSARLSLIIAASAIGLQLGLIGESVNAAIILVAIISVTIAPLIFLRILPEQLGDKLRPIVVAGAGELGLEVAKGLLAHHELVTLIDDDEIRAERARQRGLNVLNGRIERPNQKITEILDQAETLVCTHNDTEVNYQICQYARSVFGIDHVVAQVNSPNDIIRFEQIGVSTLNVALDRATMLVMLARNPAVYSLLNRTDDDKEVTEVVVQNPDCFDKAMHQISLPGDLLILALRRNGELLVPHGDTRIQAGDHLTMVGSLEFVEFGRQFFTHEEKLLGLPASQSVPKASPSPADFN
jgi:Trk K+ transport system NAD-binding subunit